MKTISGFRRVVLLRFAGTTFGRKQYLQPLRRFIAIIVRPIQTMSREVAETFLSR